MSAATSFATSSTTSPVRAETVRALFFLVGASDPGLLPRLVEPVARLGHVPTRVHASSEAGDGSELTVDLRVGGLSPRTAQLMEHALRRVVGVRQVIAVVEAD
jgi:acetolactate synthase regulatory subunit